MSTTMKKQPVKTNAKRWAAYAATGAAAAMVGTQTAEADITHVVVGSPTGDIGVGDDKYFNLGGTVSLNFFNSSVGGGYAVAQFAVFNAGFQGEIVGFSSNGFGYASNLTAGANISTQNFVAGAFGTLAYGGGYANSQFVNTGGYVAFRFNGGTQFGWARLTSNADAPANTYVVEEYAYGDVGDTVAVGQTAIPEPGSLGLLALGAIGLMASRRRRKVESN